ncbi:MAG: response regulator [Pseudobdellovibrionaceae bacterium]
MLDSQTPILVVEDEKEIRELMALHLLRQGYKVTECASATEASIEVKKSNFRLLVLDWMLPGMSGIEFLGNVKKDFPQLNVLMVTAKTEPEDIVRGLEQGADDYLTKPFEPAVLLARVKALLRRSETAVPDQDKELWDVSGLKMNLKTYDVTLDGEPLHLTPSEFKLLATMVQNQGRVLTRENLIENIQGEGINVIGRTIDTHVFGLRKKLGSWSDNVETIRGVGYRVRTE